MSKCYWTYETSIGNELAVSLFSNPQSNMDISKYYIFLGEFIKKYEKRIFYIGNISKLSNGTFQCIIRLHNRNEISFKN